MCLLIFLKSVIFVKKKHLKICVISHCYGVSIYENKVISFRHTTHQLIE